MGTVCTGRVGVWTFVPGGYPCLSLLLHVCNHLLAQTTCWLLCLGSWNLAGMVIDEDMMKVAIMKDVEGDEEELWVGYH